MKVAAEQVRRTAARANQICQCAAVEKPQAVERRDPDVTWRMMQEDEKGSVVVHGDLIGDPADPGRAQLAMVLAAVSDRVEIQETRIAQVTHALHESTDGFYLEKRLKQRCPVIVISYQQMVRQGTSLQLLTQEFVGSVMVELDEISGQHDTFCIRMQCRYFVEATPKTRQRVNTLRPLPLGLDKMEIGQPNQFGHDRAPSR